MSYCNRTDLRNRLTEAGVIFVADDDADTEAGTRELEASSDACIEEADTQINAALTPHFPIGQLPISTSNDWLKHRAIDLAAERMAERGGGTVPTSLQLAAERARADLKEVRLGTLRVPLLAYPVDSNQEERRRLGIPRAANPCCKKRGCQ